MRRPYFLRRGTSILRPNEYRPADDVPYEPPRGVPPRARRRRHLGTTGPLSTGLYGLMPATSIGFWRVLLGTGCLALWGLAFRRELFRADARGWLLIALGGGFLVALFESRISLRSPAPASPEPRRCCTPHPSWSQSSR